MVDSINALISFAACALHCARLRTSPATTAKPRPCSLVPGAAGRIVVGRNAGRVGELRRLVRIADVHVRELAGRGDLLQRGGRIALQHRVPQRVDHLAVGGDPVADTVRVTAFDRGQAAVDGIGVVRVGDDIVENRVGGERDHNDSDAQGDDARANGGEHVGSLSE
uniref:hypothetical protein n=1 Tax=Paraburkholderia dipogonis TaxID=1211383 RepID=UPI0038BA0C99